MHHFAVVLDESLAPHCADLTDSIRGFVEEDLTFKPGEAILTRVPGATVVSFQCNAEAFGVESWVHVDEDGALLLFGLPTFEAFPEEIRQIAMTRPAQAVRMLIERRGFDSVNDLGGVYSIVHVHHGIVRTAATFCGYGSLVHGRTAGRVVVGNRLALVSRLLPALAREPDHEAASWVYSTTMILGERTPYRGIHKIPTGATLRATKEAVTITHPESRFFEPSPARSEEYDAAVFERFVKRYEYYLGLPISWRAHITGGKDSRAALAAIMASGMQDRIDRFTTNGSDENGDVMIAQLIAGRLELGNHHVASGGKAAAPSSAGLDKAYRRFAYTAWRYEGQLTSWDGAAGPATKRPTNVTMMGGGGEVYRQKSILFPHGDFDGCVDKLKSWYCKHDDLGVLGDEARRFQDAAAADIIASHLDAGVTNLQPVLYITQRMANWGAGHFQNNASASVATLVDADLYRQVQSSADCQDRIHYDIVDRCYKPLLSAPLVNDRWDVLPESEQSVLSTPIKKNFPWQYALMETHGERLISEIIDGASHLGGMVDVDAVERLRGRTDWLQHSARAKMLYGIRTMIAFYSGEKSGVPDFMDEPYEPACLGSGAAVLTEALRDGGFCAAPGRDAVARAA